MIKKYFSKYSGEKDPILKADRGKSATLEMNIARVGTPNITILRGSADSILSAKIQIFLSEGQSLGEFMSLQKRIYEESPDYPREEGFVVYHTLGQFSIPIPFPLNEEYIENPENPSLYEETIKRIWEENMDKIPLTEYCYLKSNLQFTGNDLLIEFLVEPYSGSSTTKETLVEAIHHLGYFSIYRGIGLSHPSQKKDKFYPSSARFDFVDSTRLGRLPARIEYFDFTSWTGEEDYTELWGAVSSVGIQNVGKHVKKDPVMSKIELEKAEFKVSEEEGILSATFKIQFTGFNANDMANRIKEIYKENPTYLNSDPRKKDFLMYNLFTKNFYVSFKDPDGAYVENPETYINQVNQKWREKYERFPLTENYYASSSKVIDEEGNLNFEFLIHGANTALPEEFKEAATKLLGDKILEMQVGVRLDYVEGSYAELPMFCIGAGERFIKDLLNGGSNAFIPANLSYIDLSGWNGESKIWTKEDLSNTGDYILRE